MHGGLITTQSSTVYQVASGSGIVVNLNASIGDDPYPTVIYVDWPNVSASIAPLSASYDQSFVAIQSDGNVLVGGYFNNTDNVNYITKFDNEFFYNLNGDDTFENQPIEIKIYN